MAGLTYGNQVGAVRGMNQAAPGSFISDEYVRWSQDILFDRTGLLRRRAPFKTVDLYTQPSVAGERVLGVVSTRNPLNKDRIGIIVSGNGKTQVLLYNDTYQRVGVAVLDTVNSDSVMFSRPALNGGVFIGLMEQYGTETSSNEHFLYYWRGGSGGDAATGVYAPNFDVTWEIVGAGNKATYTNRIDRTAAFTFETSKVTPGMFVYRTSGDAEYYLGVVKSITDTTLLLEKDLIRTYGVNTDADGAGNTTGRIKFVNVRPYIHNHGRGLITRTSGSTTVTSGPVGTEGEGHFASAGVNNTWAIYRASDGEWIGDVSGSVTNDGLVLSNHHSLQANSIMNADEYVARRYGVIYNGNDPDKYTGVFNTTYAGYQWFGNGGSIGTENRIVFSSYHDPESVDLSKDAADSIVIPGTQQMRGMAASTAGLVVFLEDKTYLLRGNYRANFSLEELYPEGCLSAQSIVEYGGGVFWAAKSGIMFFDGATVRNLTSENLGVYYTDSIKAFDAQVNRAYSFVYKDYLFVSFSSFDSAYNPIRYEPLYATSITGTDPINQYSGALFDSDFDIDDFKPINNVPIYWDYITMYESSGVNAGVTTAKWGARITNATTTSGSKNVTFSSNPTYSGNVGGLVGLPETFIGMKIAGSGIPANTTIVEVDNTSNPKKVVISNNATASAGPISVDVYDAVWGDNTTRTVWGPLNQTEGMTFAIYLPTNAVTTISNFNFNGFIKLDSVGGVRGYAGVNAVKSNGTYPRLIDIDSMLEVKNTHTVAEDSELVENLGKSTDTYIKGPDLYLQTKHYTFGDPNLRKWFRQIFLNLYLLDGGLRMDIVDNEDKEKIDIELKKHTNWEIFTEAGYTWREVEDIVLPKRLSPDRSFWKNIETLKLSWYSLVDAEFTRRKKKFSWRYPSLGFRLYQMNKYRPSNYGAPQRPHTVVLDSWSVGFKPMRQSRV